MPTTPAPAPEPEGGRRRVEAALERQRARDLLGSEDLDTTWEHSLGFAEVVGEAPALAIDLGSGGGIPGLVVAATVWSSSEVILLDGSRRRCTALELEVDALGLGGRVRVRWGRAEDAGRDPALRGMADAVVARSFGPPAVTAECAGPLLRVGGVLVVSEPPSDGDDDPRWSDAVSELGLEREGIVTSRGHRFARLRQVEVCPPRFPRRPGRPERSPLF